MNRSVNAYQRFIFTLLSSKDSLVCFQNALVFKDSLNPTSTFLGIKFCLDETQWLDILNGIEDDLLRSKLLALISFIPITNMGFALNILLKNTCIDEHHLEVINKLVGLCFNLELLSRCQAKITERIKYDQNENDNSTLIFIADQLILISKSLPEVSFDIEQKLINSNQNIIEINEILNSEIKDDNNETEFIVSEYLPSDDFGDSEDSEERTNNEECIDIVNNALKKLKSSQEQIDTFLQCFDIFESSAIERKEVNEVYKRWKSKDNNSVLFPERITRPRLYALILSKKIQKIIINGAHSFRMQLKPELVANLGIKEQILLVSKNNASNTRKRKLNTVVPLVPLVSYSDDDEDIITNNTNSTSIVCSDNSVKNDFKNSVLKEINLLNKQVTTFLSDCFDILDTDSIVPIKRKDLYPIYSWWKSTDDRFDQVIKRNTFYKLITQTTTLCKIDNSMLFRMQPKPHIVLMLEKYNKNNNSLISLTPMEPLEPLVPYDDNEENVFTENGNNRDEKYISNIENSPKEEDETKKQIHTFLECFHQFKSSFISQKETNVLYKKWRTQNNNDVLFPEKIAKSRLYTLISEYVDKIIMHGTESFRMEIKKLAI